MSDPVTAGLFRMVFFLSAKLALSLAADQGAVSRLHECLRRGCRVTDCSFFALHFADPAFPARRFYCWHYALTGKIIASFRQLLSRIDGRAR